MSIYVIDEIMGRGKTSAMINFINQSGEEKKYLFITPYLTEVDRIVQSCSGTHFFEPLEEGGKLNNIKSLLAEGRNIVSTHALFSMLDDEALSEIQRHDYTLIVDEALNVIRHISITPWDADTILNEYATMDDDGKLSWASEDYLGKYEPYKILMEHNLAYAYNRNHWVTMLAPEMFDAFTDVYIMTYMFDGQVMRCYFDIFGKQYEYKYINGQTIDTYTIGDKYEPGPVTDFRSILHIVEDDRLNHIGNDKFALSKSWYAKHTTPQSLKNLRDNVYNFFRNIVGAKSSDTLWTTFKTSEDEAINWQQLLSGKGYTKGYLVCNARGTNSYKNRTALAYLVNRFPETAQYNFLHEQGIPFDRDAFALSEMLQWIWRSAIRDGKEITVYIPSKRMRTLLQDWIAKVSVPA